jgi:hypothetical protein
MKRNHMSPVALTLFGLACLSLTIARGWVTPATAQTADTKVSRTADEIVRQRVSVAEDGAKVAEQARSTGAGNSRDVAAWVRLRALAAADLSEKPARTRILKECVEQMHQQSSNVAQLWKAGTATYSESQKVRYDELEVQLLLAKSDEAR